MPAARGSLAGRALLLLQTDQGLIADTYVYLQDVAGLARPSQAQLLAALTVVAQGRRPGAGKEGFFRDFFACVAAGVSRGGPLQEAFDAALRLYMLPRSATIFSRLRRLRDGLRAWRRAAAGEGGGGPRRDVGCGCAVAQAARAPRPRSLRAEVEKLSAYVALSRADDFRRQTLGRRALAALRAAGTRYAAEQNAALVERARERRAAYLRALADRRRARELKAAALCGLRLRAAELRRAAARCQGKADTLLCLSLLARCGVRVGAHPEVPAGLLARRLVLRLVFLQMRRSCERAVVLEARLHAYELGGRRRFLLSVAFRALVGKYVGLMRVLVTSGERVSGGVLAGSPPGAPPGSSPRPSPGSLQALLARALRTGAGAGAAASAGPRSASHTPLYPPAPPGASQPTRTLLHSRWLLAQAFRGWRARVTASRALLRMAERMTAISLTSKAFWGWRTQVLMLASARSFRQAREERRLSAVFVSWRVFCAVAHGPVEHALVALTQYSSRSVGLAELRRRYTYMRALEASFTRILDTRLLVRALLAWRYSVTVARLFRITFTRHSRRVLEAALGEWRDQYRVRQFAALLQREYPRAVRGGSIVRLPPGARRPTYEALIYTVFGSLLAEMRPEEISLCPTLLALQKACAWSEYGHRGTRPLKYLDGGPPLPGAPREDDPEVYDRENGAVRAHLDSLPASKRAEVLAHCLQRWRRYREAAVGARRQATEMEAARAARLLRRAFQIMHRVVCLKGKVRKALYSQRRGLCRDALSSWRQALRDAALTRAFAEGADARRLAAALGAWAQALLQKRAIRLFLENPLLHASREAALAAFVGALSKAVEANAPVAGVLCFLDEQLVCPPVVQFAGDGAEPAQPLAHQISPGKGERLRSDYALLCYVIEPGGPGAPGTAGEGRMVGYSKDLGPGPLLRPALAGRTALLPAGLGPGLSAGPGLGTGPSAPAPIPTPPLHVRMARLARTASVIAAARNSEIYLESDILGRWVDLHRSLESLDRTARQHHAGALCTRAFGALRGAWEEQRRRREEALADAFNRLRLCSRALRAMAERYDASLSAFEAVSGAYLRRRAFLALRAGLLAARVQRERRAQLLARALSAWRQAFILAAAEYERAFRATRALYLLRRWRAAARARRRRLGALAAAARRRLAEAAWGALRAGWEEVRAAEEAAVSRARGILALRAWRRLAARLGGGRAALEEEVRLLRERAAFLALTEAYRERAEDEARRADALRARLCLRAWRRRARALRLGAERLEEGARLSCMRAAFLQMVAFSSEQGRRRALADGAYAHFLGRRAVAAWRQAHRLERKCSRLERTKLIQALRRWEKMARDGSIERKAEVRAERFERRRLLSKAFMTWAALAGIEALFDSASSLT